jgi:hypothetical protein
VPRVVPAAPRRLILGGGARSDAIRNSIAIPSSWGATADTADPRWARSVLSSLAHRSLSGPSSGSTWSKNWFIAVPGSSRATVKDAPVTFIADPPALPRPDSGLRDVGMCSNGDR